MPTLHNHGCGPGAGFDAGSYRIPADVDRPDRVLANLTARQVAILAVIGALLYAGYAGTRTVVPPVVFAIGAVPVAVVSGVLVLGSRDGLSLDRSSWPRSANASRRGSGSPPRAGSCGSRTGWPLGP